MHFTDLVRRVLLFRISVSDDLMELTVRLDDDPPDDPHEWYTIPVDGRYLSVRLVA